MIFLGGLGTTRTMWRAQLKTFSDAHAIDLPGHGEAALTGRVDVESIARSVLAAAPERFAFCGLSLGGMVGMWLGVFAPDRVDRLVLACTGPKLGDRESYYERAGPRSARGNGGRRRRRTRAVVQRAFSQLS